MINSMVMHSNLIYCAALRRLYLTIEIRDQSQSERVQQKKRLHTCLYKGS